MAKIMEIVAKETKGKSYHTYKQSYNFGPQVLKNGNIGCRVQLMSKKNSKEIPLRYESEGIKKIVSILQLLIVVYNKDSVYVHIMYGDITTQPGVNSSNIVSKVGNCVRQYAAQNHYLQADFKEIIHIVDMDGAYAPDSAVVEDAEAVKPVYSVTEIRTAYPE